MISHSRKFIFIHIPRTGGTSIESTLSSHGEVLQGRESFESEFFKHADAALIKEKLGETYEEYYKFTVVRNPWDWAVSNYKYNNGMHQPFLKGTNYAISGRRREGAPQMPFAKWLEWWLGEIKPSQSSMLYDDEGKLLVDHILRFESLEDDYNQLCVELGIPFTNLPVLKKTDNRDYKKLYNQFLRELVKSHLNADIDNFAYSF